VIAMAGDGGVSMLLGELLTVRIDQQIRGFATAVGKTVLTGGVGKMLNFARANIRDIRALSRQSGGTTEGACHEQAQ
jgi:hypothetical protein